MTLHPARTARHTFKLRRLSDGLIIERGTLDGGTLADSPDFELVEPELESVRERVEALGDGEITRRLSAIGVSSSTPGDRIAALASLVEAGTVELS